MFLLILLALISNNVSAKSNKIIRGPYLQSPTEHSIIIKWRTKEKSLGTLRVREADMQNVLEFTEQDANTEHEILVNNLIKNKRYYYTVYSNGVLLNSDKDLTEQFFDTIKTEATNPVRIWVLGDPGTQGSHKFPRKHKKSQLKVRDSFYKNYPYTIQCIVTLGDNTYDHGTDKEYQKGFFKPYKDILLHTPVFTTFGNHDAGKSKNLLGKSFNARSYPEPHGIYYDIFTLPGKEAYYSFDYPNVHVVILDSFDSMWETDKERVWGEGSNGQNLMLEWLKKDLANNKQQWTVVAFHHPIYQESESKSQAWRNWLQAYIRPILEDHKVDLVMSGHIHNYQRSFPVITTETKPTIQNNDSHEYLQGQGTIYMVLGSSGAAFRPVGKHTRNSIFANTSDTPGSLILEITPSSFNAKFLNMKGLVTDHFTIKAKS